MKKLLLVGLCLGMYTITYCPGIEIADGEHGARLEIQQREKVEKAKEDAKKAEKAKEAADDLRKKAAREAEEAKRKVEEAERIEKQAQEVGDASLKKSAAENLDKERKASKEAQEAAQGADVAFNQVEGEYKTAEKEATDARVELEEIQNKVAALSDNEGYNSPEEVVNSFIEGLTGKVLEIWNKISRAVQHIFESVMKSVNFKSTPETEKTKALKELRKEIKNEKDMKNVSVIVEKFFNDHAELFKNEEAVPDFERNFGKFYEAKGIELDGNKKKLAKGQMAERTEIAIGKAMAEDAAKPKTGTEGPKEKTKALMDEMQRVLRELRIDSKSQEAKNIRAYYEWVLRQ